MSHEQDNEGFRIQRTDPIDDDVAPGRSVFGDDEISFEDDDAAVPHWSQPPTGSVPKVGAPAESVTFNPQTEPAMPEPGAEDHSRWATESTGPTWAGEGQVQPPRQPSRSADMDADAFFAHDDNEPPPPETAAAPSLGEAFGVSGTGDRNFLTATIVGVGLAVLILAAMAYHEWVAVAVVTVVLAVAAVEFFNAVRVAGLQPAVLLGLASVVSMPLAVYWRGEIRGRTRIGVIGRLRGAVVPSCCSERFTGARPWIHHARDSPRRFAGIIRGADALDSRSRHWIADRGNHCDS